MAVAPIQYTARFSGPTLIEQGQDSVIVCPVYRDAAIVIVTSATVTVWNASNVKVVTAGNSPPVAGVPTYTIPSAVLAGQTPSDGWRIEWACVIGGITSTFRDLASLVYRRLYSPVTYADLLAMHGDLGKRYPSGTLQDKIDAVWFEIESDMVNQGVRPWLNMDARSFRSWHLYRSLEAVFRDNATGGADSPEWQLADLYRSKAAEAAATMTYPQATPTTGEAADAARRRAARRPMFLAGRP